MPLLIFPFLNVRLICDARIQLGRRLCSRSKRRVPIFGGYFSTSDVFGVRCPRNGHVAAVAGRVVKDSTPCRPPEIGIWLMHINP